MLYLTFPFLLASLCCSRGDNPNETPYPHDFCEKFTTGKANLLMHRISPEPILTTPPSRPCTYFQASSCAYYTIYATLLPRIKDLAGTDKPPAIFTLSTTFHHLPPPLADQVTQSSVLRRFRRACPHKVLTGLEWRTHWSITCVSVV